MRPIFIQLSYREEIIFINVEKIIALRPDKDSTGIICEGNRAFNVDQDVKKIGQLITEASKDSTFLSAPR